MPGALAAVIAVLLVALAAVVAVQQRDARRLRAAEARASGAEGRVRAAEEQLEALVGEVWQLAGERLPAAVLAVTHPNAPVPGLLRPGEISADAARALRETLDAALAAVGEERERVDAAARSAMRGATAKVQSLLYQIQSLLQELQHEHDDPRLLELDFRNELALRRIQATAVLCEAWPGLARADTPLAEIVLGAQSRVPGYERIKVANHLREPRLGVVARAAEPLAIALAELLANATSYSRPDTEVPVTLQQAGGSGAMLTVDDSGIGMDEDTQDRARRLLAGPPAVLLTELGNPPQAGFAVVGRLVRQYGFGCHIEPSPYGGVRAMLRVPAHLLTVVDAGHDLSVLVPEPARVTRAAAAAKVPSWATPEPGDEDADGAGLPTRRRRTVEPALALAPEPAAGTGPARSPEEAEARWGALQRGTRSGRDARAAARAAGTDDPSSPAAEPRRPDGAQHEEDV